jgi:hypothetical protein
MPKSRAEVLQESLEKFYMKKSVFEKFDKVVNERSAGYSLRIIEWFCNNYSKKFDVIYKTKNKEFNVYLSYKSQLDSYSKKQFDPFNRKHKGFDPFEFVFEGKKIMTTVGQMNFFKWCISNNVLCYIEANLDSIKKDMGKVSLDKKRDIVSKTSKEISSTKKTTSTKRIKRQPLSNSKSSIRRDTAKILSF